MTLNGVKAVTMRYFNEFGSSYAHCVKAVEDTLHCGRNVAQKCSF